MTDEPIRIRATDSFLVGVVLVLAVAFVSVAALAFAAGHSRGELTCYQSSEPSSSAQIERMTRLSASSGT